MIIYILKIAAFLSAMIGVVMTTSGNGTFMGSGRAFMYFTIHSNLAVAAICFLDLFFMRRKRKEIKVWFVIRFMGVVSITLTGIVFCAFLAPTLGAFVWSLPNFITHVVVPVLAIIEFLLTEAFCSRLTCSALWGTLPPLAYAVYAGIGYVRKWEFSDGIYYPYSFLNWGSPAGAFGLSSAPPFVGCVWWILAICLFILLTGQVYIRILRLLRNHIIPVFNRPAS